MLSILGFAVLIVATIFAYRTAKDYGRNAAIWALITFGVGFGIQIIIPVFIGIIWGFVLLASGTPPERMQDEIGGWATIIGIICLVLSVISVFLVLRFLSKIPEEKSFVQPPQPPADFN